MIRQTLLRALRAGGNIVRQGFSRRKIIVQRKGPTSLVTQVDRASEKMILSIILKRFPGHGIVAEESPVKDASEPYRWFIDPLDGTTNFIHGVPLVCISIGVEHQGRLLAGGVYNPITEELFFAEKGRGATLNGKAIRVSRVSSLKNSLTVTGFPYDRRVKASTYLRYFEGFMKIGQGVRRLGAAALDLAWVAAGRFEGFWEFKLSSWDVTAGALIVAEAGGRVTDARGRSFPHAAPLSTLASNGLVHNEMIQLLKVANHSLPSSERLVPIL